MLFVFLHNFQLYNCELDCFRDNMHLIETWMLSLRHKEEIVLVQEEMVTFFKSVRGKIEELECERETYLAELLYMDGIKTSASVCYTFD